MKFPRDCPFCGASGDYGGLYIVNSPVIGMRKLWCESCGATGPDAEDDEKAVNKWGTREV